MSLTRAVLVTMVRNYPVEPGDLTSWQAFEDPSPRPPSSVVH